MIKTVEALKQKLKRDIAYWGEKAKNHPDKKFKVKLEQLHSVKHWMTEENL